MIIACKLWNHELTEESRVFEAVGGRVRSSEERPGGREEGERGGLCSLQGGPGRGNEFPSYKGKYY